MTLWVTLIKGFQHPCECSYHVYSVYEWKLMCIHLLNRVMDVTDVGYVQSSALCGLWLEIALGARQGVLGIFNNNQQPPLIGDCCSTIWITLPLHHNMLALLSPLPITQQQLPAFMLSSKTKIRKIRETQDG